MSCRVENMTYDELVTLIANKDLLFDTFEDQTAEESVAKLNMVQGIIESIDGKKGYYFTGTEKQALATRVTELSKKREYAETPDRKTRAELGTLAHGLYNQILSEVVEARKAKRKVNPKNFGITENTPISTKVLKKLQKQIEILVDQAIDTQKTIDPKQFPIFLSEFKLLDPKRSIGGTADLIIVYSDNTYSIFDFKHISSNRKSAITMTNVNGEIKYTINEDIVKPFHLDQWETQIGEYKRILEEVFGLKKARHSRIIPSVMQIPTKKKSDTGNRLQKYIEDIITVDDSIKLSQVPVAFEITGEKNVDVFLDKQFGLIEFYKRKLKKEKEPLKRDLYNRRIEKLRKAIASLQLKGDIQNSIVEVKLVLIDVSHRLDVNDTNDPSYINTKELNEILTELTVYDSHFRTALNAELENYKNDPETYKNLKTTLGQITYSIKGAIEAVENKLTERVMESASEINTEFNKDEYDNILTEEESYWKLLFKTTSQLGEKNPYFDFLYKQVNLAFLKRKSKLKEIYAELEEKTKALFEYGNSQGLSRQDTFKLLYNENTGNLHYTLSKEFFNLLAEKRTEGDIKWFKENYQIKADAESRINEYRASYYKREKSTLDQAIKEGIIDAELAEKQLAQLMKNWDSTYNVLTTDEAWTSHKAPLYLELKPEMQKKYSTEEYDKIMSTPALADYYMMYKKYNSMFREMMGLSYDELPDNFIPEVRSDMIDMFFNKGIYSPVTHIAEFAKGFNVRSDDYMYNIDEVTGKIKREVPKFFLNSEKKEKDFIKSFDLSANMYMFADMALNYSYMTEIETDILALRNIMANQTIVSRSSSGKLKKNFMSKVLNINPEDSVNIQTFDALVDYYLYGIKTQDKGLGQNGTATKVLGGIQNYVAATQLGLKIPLAVGAFVAPKLSSWIEASKGKLFNKKQWNEAHKELVSNREKALGVAALFDMHSDVATVREARKLSSSKMKKWINLDNLFWFLRKGDEMIDNQLAVAMSKNYGFDSNGTLRRLENLPPDSKSIYDSLSINEETKEVFIKGLTDLQLLAFKTALREGQRRIKGTLSQEDIYAAKTNLILSALLQFKTWMPGVMRERISQLKYNKNIDAVEIGRYNVLWEEIKREGNTSIGKTLFQALSIKLPELLFDMATFGYIHKTKISEQRALRIYREWKNKNPKEAKNVTFEQYKDAKQKQLRALIIELRIITGFLALVIAVGGGADEDDKWYRQYGWAGRQFYRVLNRTYTELAFFYDPIEAARLAGNASIPSISIMIKRTQNFIKNTIDETGDIFSNDPDKRDKTPPLYYTTDFFPGIAGIKSLFELFPADIEKDR